MNLKQEALDKLVRHAETVYGDLSTSGESDVIIFYCGDLNQGYANALTGRVEKLINSKISDKQAHKRFFSVYLEAIQNIRHHAIQDGEGRVHGAVVVFAKSNYLCARFLNIVSEKQATVLEKRYGEVNGLSRADLKKRYMDIMMNGELSSKGGAGLGIITIVLRSKNKSDVQVLPLSSRHKIFQSEVCVDVAVV